MQRALLREEIEHGATRFATAQAVDEFIRGALQPMSDGKAMNNTTLVMDLRRLLQEMNNLGGLLKEMGKFLSWL